MSDAVKNFWGQLSKYWPSIYEGIKTGTPEQRVRCLEVVNGFLSEEQFKQLEIELTFGEINRVSLPHSSELVEMYISPRIRKDNIPAMEALFNGKIVLPNLNVMKYRAYNPTSELISTIEQSDITAKYEDFGCQAVKGYDDEKKPILNIVLHVKNNIADKFLIKKPVTFVHPDGKQEVIEKWIPSGVSLIDIFLTNVLGEYNLIHHVGYIEFLPEGDTLIADGSVFTELADLRQEIISIEKLRGINICTTCSKRECQTQLFNCTKCKIIKYCSKECQISNWSIHKHCCKTPTEISANLYAKKQAEIQKRITLLEQQRRKEIADRLAREKLERENKKLEQTAARVLAKQKTQAIHAARRITVKAERDAKRKQIEIDKQKIKSFIETGKRE